jgi:hypothetical protein
MSCVGQEGGVSCACLANNTQEKECVSRTLVFCVSGKSTKTELNFHGVANIVCVCVCVCGT